MSKKSWMRLLALLLVCLLPVCALAAPRDGYNGPIPSEVVPVEVTPAPKESTQVRIPTESGEMFRRYNALQKGQGYDLTKFSGRKVMRYVYEITNFPGATEPVYATVLVYKNKVIGGDVTDTSAKGKIRGFQMPPAAAAPTTPATTPTAPTAPAETTAPTLPQ